MDKIQKAIGSLIDPSQEKYWEGVQWIVRNGMLGSGRTHLLALAFIQEAIYNRHPIHIWDHHRPHNHRETRYILKEIEKCVYLLNKTISEELELHILDRDMIKIIVRSTQHPRINKFL